METSKIEDVKKDNTNEILFIVDDTYESKKILPNINVIEDNKFKIQIKSNEEIPGIVKTLVENNIKIYGIREEEISLEEAFLKRTGGNVID